MLEIVQADDDESDEELYYANDRDEAQIAFINQQMTEEDEYVAEIAEAAGKRKCPYEEQANSDKSQRGMPTIYENTVAVQ